MRIVMDKWVPLALFVSANIALGSARIVSTIQEVNAKTEVFTSGVLKDNQGLRLTDLRALFLWLENPGIVLTRLEVNKRAKLMKIKLYLYYLVANPAKENTRTHPSLSMSLYATSRTSACLCRLLWNTVNLCLTLYLQEPRSAHGLR
jgi:hypothetical protein